MFLDNEGINYKKFCFISKPFVKHLRLGVATLNKVENSLVYHSEAQAEIFNKQFHSVFISI